MRRIIFKFHTGFCGSDGIEAFLAHDGMSDDEISEKAHWAAVEHAAGYGIYPEEEHTIDEGGNPVDEDEMSDEYSSNIEGWWEEYDADKHDQQRPGGGSFEDDFKTLER